MNHVIRHLLRGEKTWPDGVLDDVTGRGVKEVTADPKNGIVRGMATFFVCDEMAREKLDDMEWQRIMFERGSGNFWYKTDDNRSEKSKIVFVTRVLSNDTLYRSSSEWPVAMMVTVVDKASRSQVASFKVPVPQNQVNGSTLERMFKAIEKTVARSFESEAISDCPVCLEPILYGEAGNLSRCSHVVCKACIGRLPSMKYMYMRPDQIACPVCRTPSDR